jgi:hypothetical protein
MFHWEESFFYDRDAQKEAEKWRKRGYLSRVIESFGPTYQVWVSNKKSRKIKK